MRTRRYKTRSPFAHAAGPLLYQLKTIVAKHPRVALPIARWRGHGFPLAADTEVLIEGYPRSANSFSVAAFELAQGRPVKIAHHLHAPAHVIAAINAGVPALVLIRDPEDAVLEFVIVKPRIGIRQAVLGYLRFYGPLVPHRSDFVMGSFEEVTSDFGAVIRKLNERFGTSFREFQHSDENVQTVFDAMERYWRGRVGEGVQLERVVGRPSEVRERMKEGLPARYRAETTRELRARAQALHDRLLSAGAGSSDLGR